MRALFLIPLLALAACEDRPMVTELGEPSEDCLPKLVDGPYGAETEVAVEGMLRFDDSEHSALFWLIERGEEVQLITEHRGGDPIVAFEAFEEQQHEKLPAVFSSDGINVAKLDLGEMAFKDVRATICPMAVDGIHIESVKLSPTNISTQSET